MLKRIYSILTIAIILLNISYTVISASSDFPQTIWKPLEYLKNAEDAKNDAEMIKWGEEVVRIMEGAVESDSKTNLLGSKYYHLGQLCERVGDMNSATTYFEKYIPFGEKLGWDDGVKYAKNKVKVLKPQLNIFIESSDGQRPFYNAKFEPKNGIYFGSTYDNDPRIGSYEPEKVMQYFPKKNSTYLMYLEFGDDITTLGRYTSYFADAKKNGSAVMLAWNTYDAMENIESKRDYIIKTIDYISKTGVKVFLRFANEMNVGPNGVNSTSYIKAFRMVADIAHTKENIAMVWSPNDLGALDRPFESYYPGNEYVDWVGVSLYTIKYFQGKKDHGDDTDPLNTYFLTGDYAHPVYRLKPIMEFMEKNNIQKPVMVSEGGVTHTVKSENENAEDWALIQLRRMYAETIRIYPNLKLMCYFNVHIPKENDIFALYKNQSLNDLYNKMVENSYFISDFGKDAGFYYKRFESGIFKQGEKLRLSAVAYYPKTMFLEVKYSLDGRLLNVGTYSPYEYALDTSGIDVGEHTLTVGVFAGNNMLLEKSMSIVIENNIKIQINGEELTTDQPPVIMEGRTLVPLRSVFAALGANVEWNGEKRSVKGTKGNTVVELTIDSQDVLVNGKSQKIDVPAKIINGRTMVPARFIAETLGANVTWDADTKTVNIEMK